MHAFECVNFREIARFSGLAISLLCIILYIKTKNKTRFRQKNPQYLENTVKVLKKFFVSYYSFDEILFLKSCQLLPLIYFKLSEFNKLFFLA